MKKVTAWLLAAALAFSGIPAYASPAEGKGFLLTEEDNAGTQEENALGSREQEQSEVPGTEEITAEAETESHPETETGTEDVSETEGTSESESGVDTETETQTETETEAETETETEIETETETETIQKENASENGIDWDKIEVPEDAKGAVEVILGNALPMKRGADLNISLTRNSELIKKESVELAAGPKKKTVLLDGLDAGTYTLLVEAEGFADFKQEIEVQRNVRTAEIYAGFRDDVEYEAGNAHPGALLAGDVDGDGAVNETDGDILIDSMSAHRTAVADVSGNTDRADLNKDGIIDLLDLQYYAVSMDKIGEKADFEASLTTRVADDAAGVGAGKNTQVEGRLEDLLSSEGKITLSVKDGEAISEETPVEIGIAFAGTETGSGEGVQVEEIVIRSEGIREGNIILDTEDGEIVRTIRDGRVEAAGRSYAGKEDAFVIDLGGQVAVKRVTIRVTAAQKGSNNLVEISKVEFLNGMENRIPEPEMNIPKNFRPEPENKAFTLGWDKEPNVTGYEVEIEHKGETQQVRTAVNSIRVQAFGKKKLVNGEVYKVRVQSVNGAWESGFSEWLSIVPKAEGRPEAPDYVKAEGGYRRITVKWKDMDDTDSYCVYYREKGQGAYQKVGSIETNSYEITRLKDRTRYEIYVTGVNELGESDPSLISEAETEAVTPVQMPKYKLINEAGKAGSLTSHIASVTRGRGRMVNSPLDEGKTNSALGAADNDFGSYYQMEDWDDGGLYHGEGKGLTFTFDQPYEMNYITFAEAEELGNYSNASVFWYDGANPNGKQAAVKAVLKKRDENGRSYYMIKLAEPVTAQKLRLGFTRSGNYRNIVIAEVNFYHYDSLEDDILALYADDLHTCLKDSVTQKDIDALQKRLDTQDEKSGEYHPEKEMLQKELDNARGLLDSTLGETLEISPLITAAKDGHLGFGGLNGWQPLGVTAYEGEQLVIYVGHNTLKTGADTSLKLIATQYHAESNSLAAEVARLKVGRNEVTVPGLNSLAQEHGGALYIQYTGNNANDRYAVRVSGGAKEPVLNLYGVTKDEERHGKILSYIEELEEHVQNQKNLHGELHEAVAENSGINREYDPKNCILGATDIMLDQIMYSVSGEQILKALGSGTTKEKAEKLDSSLRAMDQMMHLFYQHKGLNDRSQTPAKDRLPSQHLNIRYMRMFKGAFMYAGGNHIGIEWDSVKHLAEGRPIRLDENGKYADGNFFGWGIAHEIGHNINQNAYSIAEITNNYFSQLTTARDTNESVRFRYQDVYEKVTSGTIGRSESEAVQLALYWQLHLAYDRGYNFATYDSYEEQFKNLFYARVDTYARDVSRAPAPGGVKLTLEGDAEQKLMRLACAAAEADLMEFFTRWGMMPDAGTRAYAAQFEKEPRAVYYLNDEARVYEIEHGTDATFAGKNVVGASSRVSVNEAVPNEVTISIKSSADPEVLLGYEIARYTYEGGRESRKVVGFTTESQWQDHVTDLNNRAITYEVTAVDKFGYYSAPQKVGTVRISHDGSHDKAMWKVMTNMVSKADEIPEADENMPCEPQKKSAVSSVIDYDYQKNTYAGTSSNADASVLLQFGEVLAVSGIKYTVTSGNAIGAFTVEISTDGKNWTKVLEDTFDPGKKIQTIYFRNEKNDPWVATYDAAYVRLKAKGSAGKELSITELDILGPSGDSIRFGVEEGNRNSAVGILAKEYEYDGQHSIPAGSLVFMGRYKGNPAYNVVLVYDDEGNIIGGTDEDGAVNAAQIILADVPENGLLGEVSDGIWIYWIEPDKNGEIPKLSGNVRAELYRVDDAMTNEGQRLVSDTVKMLLPEKLGEIEISGNGKSNAGE